ncbi:hypothetical protein LAZ67_17000139 [Cordylochernes scorpioides]|uniref:Uncharacterized protein n=1 Tax=Cordylochernes scorpioides TaxID=51811 RepID=A0ABY6LDV8_9ARAC|nr:hypothetical protein LAZ67_17000139 [Cordylochernes scorpioides]
MGCRSTAWAALAALACFLGSLDGDFVHDDVPAVRDNPDVQGTSPLTQLWLDDFWGRPMAHPASHKSYRPITVLSFREVVISLVFLLGIWPLMIALLLLLLSCPKKSLRCLHASPSQQQQYPLSWVCKAAALGLSQFSARLRPLLGKRICE